MTHFRRALDDTRIDELLARYRPGYSLELYTQVKNVIVNLT